MAVTVALAALLLGLATPALEAQGRAGGPGLRGGEPRGPVAPDPGAPAPAPTPTPSPAPPPAPGGETGPDPGADPGAGPACSPRPPAAAVCSDPAELPAAAARDLVSAAVQAADEPAFAVVVVDRLGRPLARYQGPAATAADLERALGLARTGAFFSNNQAPLSSRTVRFVSGIHFPPGVARTPNAALYGIENTNRGCDLAVPFDCGKDVPPARSLAGIDLGLPCDFADRSGCGTGPVTGKNQPFDANPGGRPATVPVDPGGLPVYRGSSLVGGIGVAAPDPNLGEYAALQAVAANGALPDLAALAPGVVFIDGIRLPFVDQFDPPPGAVVPGPAPAPGSITGLRDGRCAPDGWLVSPRSGNGLTAAEVQRIVAQSIAVAERTRAVIRLPLGSRSRMVIAVGDRDGEILGLYRMADATVFSIDVAVAKARNVVWFSGPGAVQDLGLPAGTAVSNRTISFGAQPLFPAGIDGSAPGPFFQLFQDDLARACSQGSQPPNPNQNGIVFFAGSLPLVDASGTLVGGLGISGDGVEQDDYVAFLGADGFQPAESTWADRVFLRGVRLPFLKFPRNPEG